MAVLFSTFTENQWDMHGFMWRTMFFLCVLHVHVWDLIFHYVRVYKRMECYVFKTFNGIL